MSADILERFLSNQAGKALYGKRMADTPLGKAMLALGRDAQAAIVAEAVGRLVAEDDRSPPKAWYDSSPRRDWTVFALRGLLQRTLPLDDSILVTLLRWPARAPSMHLHPLSGIVTAVERRAATGALPSAVAEAAATLVTAIRTSGSDRDMAKLAARLAALVHAAPQLPIEPGEAWSDAALADLAAMDGPTLKAWTALLAHCRSASGGKPAAAWLKAGSGLLAALDHDQFHTLALRWLKLVEAPRPADRPNHQPDITPPHQDVLKGLVWLLRDAADGDVARGVASLAVSAYKKVPGVGPRLVALGNACVGTLGAIPGTDAIGQLALLRVKVKFGTAQKEIDKALTAAAAREGLPREEIEELAVPAYGLDDVGVRRETFGEYDCELRIDGSDAALHWSKAGKPLKSVPAAAKAAHGEAVKELQAALKDVQKMLPAQRERLDSLYLQRKTWPVAVWAERYRDHPLVGTIARRLVWTFDGTAAVWHDGRVVDVTGAKVTVSGTATVALWHPIDATVEAVLAWRTWFEERRVQQPFKQAHREVYRLTDAERTTRVYSNRFAAHVLRQHQYHALCAARGWKNRLRLMVDDCYPPTSRPLTPWGLRAEYWVEGIGDEFGRDTTESGAYARLVTDQVRFYREGAPQRLAHAGGGGYERLRDGTDAPIPLEEVPALVFSEVMRDVDLFVGVASVGNDPTWADGGPGGRFRDYWHDYAFGALSGTAATRKATLERLIPRLKIAARCSFADRFLVVRGDRRTYKVHLGSGNILMEPNDEYLCIVPKQSGSAGRSGVFLPFEGDNTLSVILSKAFLLADDTKITDPTITRQIARGSE